MASSDEMKNDYSYYTGESYYEGNNQYQSSTQSGVFVAKPNGRGINTNEPLQRQTMNESDSNGYATASLILGILSIVMVGIIQGVLAIIFGNMSLKRKQRNRGCALAGIITGSVGITLFAVIAILVVIGLVYSDDGSTSNTASSFSQDYGEDDDISIGDIYGKGSQEDIAGYNDTGIKDNVFTCSDGSEIVFDDDEFTWYKAAGEYDDNYRYGTYRVYYGSEAEDVLHDELSNYSVTEDEMDDYFDRNKDSDFYSQDNFCVLILNNTGSFIDGQEGEQEAYETPYMGFIEDGYYEAANMNSGNYAYFTVVEY